MKKTTSLLKSGLWTLCLSVLAFAATALPDVSAQTIRYVTPEGGASTQDGLSWATAYAGSQLDAAVTDLGSASGSDKQLWVKQGTYQRSGTLDLNVAGKVYGGFKGTEGALAERVTVIGGGTTLIRDGSWAGTMVLVNAVMTLDGLTVDGRDSSITANANGGGIRVVQATAAAAVVQNCIVRNCGATGGGGIAILPKSSILNCIIEDCTASTWGGAIYTNTSEQVIRDCIVRRNWCSNTSNGGGGVFLGGPNTVLDNCLVENNVATLRGGGVYCFGNTNQAISNCIIRNNIAGGNGGGVGAQNPYTLNNCIISGNTSAGLGGGAYVSNANSNINDCIIESNRATGDSSDGGGIYSAGHINVSRCTLANNFAYNESGAFHSPSNVNSTIKDCLIVCNSAGRGAVTIRAAGCVMQNCTVAYNTHSGTYSDYAANACVRGVYKPLVKNCLAWGNSGPIGAEGADHLPVVTHTLGQTGPSVLSGNASAVQYSEDPLFVGPVPAAPGLDANWRTYNFTLKPTSIAINRGLDVTTSTTDLAGNARTQFGFTDMGAYELAAKGNPILTSTAKTDTFNNTAKMVNYTVDPAGMTMAAVPPCTNVGTYQQAVSTIADANWNMVASQPTSLTITPATISAIAFDCEEGKTFDPATPGNAVNVTSMTVDPVQTVPNTVKYYRGAAEYTSFPTLPGNYVAKMVPTVPANYNITAADTVGFTVTGVSVPVIVLSTYQTTVYDNQKLYATLISDVAPATDLTVSFDVEAADWTTPGTATIAAGTTSVAVVLSPLPVTTDKVSTVKLATSAAYTSYNETTVTLKHFTETYRRYIDNRSVATAPDGLTWETAYRDNQFQKALYDVKNATTPAEVWVAQGTYTIVSSKDDAGIYMCQNVMLYGGFLGNETALEQRADKTGATTIIRRSTNNCRIISFSGDALANSFNSGIDGFTLDGQNQVLSGNTGGAGIGFYLNNSATPGTIIARNCIIKNCIAKGVGGGGILVYRGAPLIENCIIDNCSSSVAVGGGGLYIYGEAPAAYTVRDCIIRNCNATAGVGGGVASLAKTVPVTFQNVTIENCKASTNGGGVQYALTGATFTGCKISGCSANNGGGFYSSGVVVTIADCEFTGNSASNLGGAVNVNGSTGHSFDRCLFYKNITNTSKGNGGFTSYYGGALHIVDGVSTVSNTRFISNRTYSYNWGRGGALYFGNLDATGNGAGGTVFNCLFAHNQANEGTNVQGVHGGCIGFANNGTVKDVINCTFVGNAPRDNLIYSLNTVKNTVFWNNTTGTTGIPTDAASCNAGPGMTNAILNYNNTINYTDPAGPCFKSVGSMTQGYNEDAINYDFSLAANSRLINRADSNVYPVTIDNTTKDLAGNARVYTQNDLGLLDIGAYEATALGTPMMTVSTGSAVYDGTEKFVPCTTDPSTGLTLTSATPCINAGTYNQVVSAGAVDLWNTVTANPAVLTITPATVATVDFSCTEDEVFTYGNDNVITATAETDAAQVVPGGVKYYKLDGTGESNTFPSVAGSYYAKFVPTIPSNYTFTVADTITFSLVDPVVSRVRYVTVEGAGAKDGLSWATAYDQTQLQTAINDMTSSTEQGFVWVKQGTYTVPTGDVGLSNAGLCLNANVQMYGGFDGTETGLSQRADKTGATTILTRTLTTHRVMSITERAPGVVFDGFTIDGQNVVCTQPGAGVCLSYNQATNGTIFRNCIVKNCKSSSGSGGAGFIIYSGAHTITNCTVQDCELSTGTNGGGMQINGGKHVIDGCLFSNCRAVAAGSRGGAIATTSTAATNSITVKNSIFRYCSAVEAGGGIGTRSTSATPITVENCLFDTDTANYGAGIFTQSTALVVTGCTFQNGTANNNGGGIHSDVTGISVKNSMFTGNLAKGNGGAIGASSGNAVAISISNVIFKNNKATGIGGAIWTTTPMTVTNSTFSTNTAANGAGFYMTFASTVDSCRFEGNTSAGNGSIHTTADLTCTNSIFLNNTIANGAGIYNTANLTVDSCRFEGNTVSGGGGGIYTTSNVTCSNSKFYNNTANGNSGAIKINPAAAGQIVTVSNCEFVGNTGNYSGVVDMDNNNVTTTFDRCLFAANMSKQATDANTGAVGHIRGVTTTFTNSIFINNKRQLTTNAASLFGWYGGTINVTNCTITGNDCRQIAASSNVKFNNTIIYGNSTTTNSGAVTNGWTDNPGFVAPVSFIGFTDATKAADIASLLAADYHTVATSPVVNRGNSALYTGLTDDTVDLDSKPRVYKVADVGEIDIGAYETAGLGTPIVTFTDTYYRYNGALHALTASVNPSSVLLNETPISASAVGAYPQTFTTNAAPLWNASSSASAMVIDPGLITAIAFSCADGTEFPVGQSNTITATPTIDPVQADPGVVKYYNFDGTGESLTFPTAVGSYYAKYVLPSSNYVIASGVSDRVEFGVISPTGIPISLTARNTELPSGGATVVTASIEDLCPTDLTITLSLNPTYWTASSVTCTIPAGQHSGSVTVYSNSGVTGTTSINVVSTEAYYGKNSLAITLTAAADAPIVYVTVNGGATVKNGLSWETAYGASFLYTADVYNQLQDKEVWVAAGTYLIQRSGGAHGIRLSGNMSMYGGFAGTEATRLERADNTGATTIFKHAGDANAHRVLTLDNAINTGTLIVDGVTVDGAGFDSTDNGGAVGIWKKDAIFRNCIVKNGVTSKNTAGQGGAGIIANGNNITIDSVHISNCRATGANGDGGGILFYRDGAGQTGSTVTNCVIENCSANRGAGIFANANNVTVSGTTVAGGIGSGSGAGIFIGGTGANIKQSVFANNKANGTGGAIDVRSTGASISDCLVLCNEGAYGSGMNLESAASVYGCTVVCNKGTATNGYAAVAPIRIVTEGTTIANTISWGNNGPVASNEDDKTPTIVSVISDDKPVSGGTIPAGLLLSDPQFVTPTASLPAPGLNANWRDIDVHLTASSAAVNIGDNSLKQNDVDLDGNPRISIGIIDAGCYESNLPPAPGVLADGTRVYYINNTEAIGSGYSPADPAGITQISQIFDLIGNALADTPVVYFDKGTYVGNWTAPAGVKMYGGFDFAGGKTTLDVRTYETDVTLFTPASASSAILTLNGTAANRCGLDGMSFTGATEASAVIASGTDVNRCLFNDNAFAGSEKRYCLFLQGSASTVVNSKFQRNTGGDAYGLAIHITADNVVIDGCLFSENNGNGPVIASEKTGGTATNVTAKNSIIRNNYSGNNGAAFRLEAPGNRIENCLIQNNSNSANNVIFFNNAANSTVVGCSFINNGSTNSPIYNYNSNSANITVSNTLFFNNGTTSYQVGTTNLVTYANCATEIIVNGTNNMMSSIYSFADIFMNPSYTTRGWNVANAAAIAAADWRLNATAPVINAGDQTKSTLSTDLADVDRVLFGQVDIGAYEATTWFGDLPSVGIVGESFTFNGQSMAAGSITYTSDNTTNISIVDDLLMFLAATNNPVAITATFPDGSTATKRVSSILPLTPAENGWFVSDATGNDDNNGTSATTPFKTVTKALESAAAGDTIYVAQGTYTNAASPNDRAFLINKQLQLYGGWNADFSSRYPVAYPSILKNTNTNARVVAFDNGGGSILDGFTLTGGAYSYEGAGLKVESNSANVTVNNCIIIGNTSNTQGGGVYLNALTTFTNNTITGNTSGTHAGGVRVAAAGITLDNCIITNNLAKAGNGGGVAMNVAGKLVNCVIAGNKAYWTTNNNTQGNGGGIATTLDAGTPGATYVVEAYNCIISYNECKRWAAGVLGGSNSNHKFYNCTIIKNGTGADGGPVEQTRVAGQYAAFYNCVLWDNGSISAAGTNPSYTCYTCAGSGNAYSAGTSGGTITRNVTTADAINPGFISLVTARGAASWNNTINLHLIKGSVLVNTGTNANYPAAPVSQTDMDGNARIRAVTIDIGCYESEWKGDPSVPFLIDSTYDYLKGTSRNVVWGTLTPATGWTTPTAQENAGIYDQYLVYPESEQYYGYSDSAVLTINPAQVVYSFSCANGAVFKTGETGNAITCTLTATPTQAVASTLKYYKADNTDIGTTFPIEEGDYYAMVTVTEANLANYTFMNSNRVDFTVMDDPSSLPTLTLTGSADTIVAGTKLTVTATLGVPATQDIIVTTRPSSDWVGSVSATIVTGESSVTFDVLSNVSTKDSIVLYVDGEFNLVAPLAVDLNSKNTQPVRYVTQSGGNLVKNGMSWETAYAAADLQTAVNEMTSITAGPKQVWVAQGIYDVQNATASSNGDAGLLFVANMGLYGGFVGNETSPDERPADGNKRTIIRRAPGVMNCRIVSLGGAASNSLIDGFTVDGQNVAITKTTTQGAGIYLGGINTKANNCIVINAICGTSTNTGVGGGGFYANAANVSITNCQAINCTAPNNPGGGIYMHTSASNVIVDNCQVIGCSATIGGGIYVNTGTVSSPTTINNTIVAGNSSSSHGAGIYITPDAYTNGNNLLVANNSTATQGGGIWASDGSKDETDQPQLRRIFKNCTVVNNLCTGAEVTRTGVQWITMYNCVVWGNRGAAQSTPNLQGYSCSGSYNAYNAFNNGNVVDANLPKNILTINATANPGFIKPTVGAGKDYWDDSSDWRLASTTSVLYNAGNSTHAAATGKDFEGYGRVAFNEVDIGAYELQLKWTNDFPSTVLTGYEYTLNADSAYADGTLTYTADPASSVNIVGNKAYFTVLGTTTITLTATLSPIAGGRPLPTVSKQVIEVIAPAPIIYVSATAGNDANHGRTPDLPKKTLSFLNSTTASPLLSGIDSVYVAAGTYSAAPTSAGHAFTVLTANLSLVGGWNDAFTARDVTANVSTLTKTGGAGRPLCISAADVTVDGFTITGGNPSSQSGGGGVQIPATVAPNATLRHCIITNNSSNTSSANIGGGGLYILSSGARLEDCIISGNTALGNGGVGGGINIAGADAVLERCVISGNTSNSTTTSNGGGGGLYISAAGTGATLSHCRISGNKTTTTGTGGRGGAICMNSGNTVVTISNTLMDNNTAASNVGGIFAYDDKVLVTNCTIVRNHTAADAGSATRFCTVNNSILWGNTNTTTNYPITSTVGSGNAVGNYEVKPGFTAILELDNNTNSAGFVSPTMVSGVNGLADTADWRLMPSSLCINRTLQTVSGTDLGGNSRTQYGFADIGAYETAAPGVLRLAAADVTEPYTGSYHGIGAITSTETNLPDTAVVGGYTAVYPVTPFPVNAGAYTVQLMPKDVRWISLDTALLTITKLPLYLTVNDASTTYGAALPTPSHSYTGFINGETEATAISGSITYPAIADTVVGSYPIAVDTSTLVAVNYAILKGTYGNYIITPALLTLTTDPAQKTYGMANPTLTGSYSGFQYGETDAEITTPATITTVVGLQTGAGTYEISADTTVFVADNYIVGTVDTAVFTVMKATLTMRPNPTSIELNVGQSLPDPSTTFTISYTGLMSWDSNAGQPNPGVLVGTPTVQFAPNVNTSNVATFPTGIQISMASVTSANYTLIAMSGSVIVTSANIGFDLKDVTIYESQTAEVPFHIVTETAGTKVTTTFMLTSVPQLRTGEYTIGVLQPTTATLTFAGRQGTLVTYGTDTVKITVTVPDDRYAKGDKQITLTLLSATTAGGEKMTISSGVGSTVIKVTDLGNGFTSPFSISPDQVAAAPFKLQNFAASMIEQTVDLNQVESIEPDANTSMNGSVALGADGTSLVYSASTSLSDTAFFAGYTDTFYLLARMKNGAAPIPVEAVVYVGDAQTKGTPILVPFDAVRENGVDLTGDRFTQTPFIYAEYYRPYETVPAGERATPSKVMLKTVAVPTEGVKTAEAMLNLTVNMTNAAALKSANAAGSFTADVIGDEAIQKKSVGLTIRCSGTESDSAGTAVAYDIKCAAAQIHPPSVTGVTRWVDSVDQTVYLRVEGSWFGASPTAALEYNAGAVKTVSLARATTTTTLKGDSATYTLDSADLTPEAGANGVLWVKLPKSLPASERIDLIIKSGCGIGAAAGVQALIAE